jgi:hypothetical protein
VLDTEHHFCGINPEFVQIAWIVAVALRNNAVLADPKFKARLADLGGTAPAGSPTNFVGVFA